MKRQTHRTEGEMATEEDAYLSLGRICRQEGSCTYSSGIDLGYHFVGMLSQAGPRVQVLSKSAESCLQLRSLYRTIELTQSFRDRVGSGPKDKMERHRQG